MGGFASSSSDDDDDYDDFYVSESESDDDFYSNEVSNHNVREFLYLLLILMFCLVICCVVFANPHQDLFKVAMLQIALSGRVRSIKRELNKTALTTNTSTSSGLNSMLRTTISTLLKHSDYWVSGYSNVDEKDSVVGMWNLFDKLCDKERGKFEVESLVNVDNVIVQREFVCKGTRKCRKELMVVTIVVGVKGSILRLPRIDNEESLKCALENLSECQIRDGDGVKVIWTPPDGNDALLPEELIDNYPLLKLI